MGAPVEAQGPNEEFARELRRQRWEVRGLTQVQLQERMLALGDPIGQGMLSQYESGKTGVSDIRCANLTRALDCGDALWNARRRDAEGYADRETRGYLIPAAA